jgi:hypothetical protein
VAPDVGFDGGSAADRNMVMFHAATTRAREDGGRLVDRQRPGEQMGQDVHARTTDLG